MSSFKIIPRNHVGTNDDEFVGMKFDVEDGNPIIRAIFPLGYHYAGKEINGKKDNPEIILSEENQEELKVQLLSLLTMISNYTGKIERNLGNLEDDSSLNYPFHAYVAIIKDFMKSGYYIESEIVHKRGTAGKIDWKRTVSNIKPLVQGSSLIYTEFIIKKHEKKTDKLISLIHEWCVHDAFEKIGYIFKTRIPRKPALRNELVNSSKQYFISVINDALLTTFNDRYKMLFKAMKTMLEKADYRTGEAFFYGTTNFRSVWEKLINDTYGVSNEKKKEYRPGAEWMFSCSLTNDNDDAESYEGSRDDVKPLEPDTIMLSDDEDNNVFVLDAKYYGFDSPGGKKKLPGTSDINKQVTYGVYAERIHIDKAYNAFLIPYDIKHHRHSDIFNLKTGGHRIKKYAYIGYARMKGNVREDKKHEKVLAILVDTKWLMENAGVRGEQKELINFIKQKHKK